jgi:hypothetical protein
MKNNVSPASYYDAYISEKNIILLFSKLDVLAHDDHTHARMFSWINGQWHHRDLPFMVNSAFEMHPKNGTPRYIINSLGLMSGAVEVYQPKGIKIEYEFLPGATLDKGLIHLQQIKEIDGRLYVVGPTSQIFRRKIEESPAIITFKGAQNKDFQGRMDQWEVFNQGVESPSLTDFEAKGMSRSDAMGVFIRYCSLSSIDGSSASDLYAVGGDGVMIHRSTGPWKFLSKVTNADLLRVRQIDSKTVYAVGDKGIFLKGNAADGFKQIPTNNSDNLSGLEVFNGKIYIGASSRGVMVYDGKAVTRVPGLPDFDCHTLHAKDGQLLAVGSKHAYLTDDAKTWTFLKNPDNE